MGNVSRRSRSARVPGRDSAEGLSSGCRVAAKHRNAQWKIRDKCRLKSCYVAGSPLGDRSDSHGQDPMSRDPRRV